jgi:hypothetical protein
MSIILDREFVAFDDQVDRLVINLEPYVPINWTIDSWKDGLAIYGEDCFEPINDEKWDPEVSIFYSQDNEDHTHPVSRFARTIPKDLILEIKKINCHQLTVLRLLKRQPLFLDLLKTVPGLFILAVHRYLEDDNISADEFDEVLFQKRVKILQWCNGGVGTNSLLKFLSKLTMERYDEHEIGLLFKYLQNPTLQAMFRHVPRLNINNIELLTNHPEIMQCAFVLRPFRRGETIPNRDLMQMFHLWRDSGFMGQHLDVPNYENRLLRCSTLEDLHTIHDEWTDRLNAQSIDDLEKKYIKKYGSLAFPDQPFDGLDSFEPITTPSNLLQEGNEMHHCIGGYADRVFEKRCYVYRVNRPDRGTLLIRLNSKGMKAGFEFKLKYNQIPSNEAMEEVMKWYTGL